MHTLLQALTFFLAARASQAEYSASASDPLVVGDIAPKAGEHCFASVQVDCVLQADGSPCSDLYDISGDECGLTELTYTFSWRNLNQDASIDLYPTLTVPKVQNALVTGFDKSRMAPGETRKKVVKKTVDTCQKGKANASLKLEGYVTGYMQEDGTVVEGYNCFAWKKLQVLVRHMDGDGPIRIKDAPSQRPPGLELEIQCHVDSDVLDIPCSELVENNAYLNMTGGSLLPIKYTYIATNVDLYQRSVVLQGLVSGGINLPVEDAFVELGFGEKYVHVTNGIIDLSQQSSTGMITKEAMAICTSIPGFAPGTASATHSFSTPPIPNNFQWAADPSVECTYQGMSCEDYMNTNGCFTGEADIKYNIQNVGSMCNIIERIDVLFASDPSRTIALDDDYSCSDRRICPGDVWTLEEKRVISGCLIRDVSIMLEITTGSGKTLLSIDGNTSAKAPTSTLSTNWSLSTECASRPTKIWFKFTGSACPTIMTRRLRYLNHNYSGNSGSKHQCNQLGQMNGSFTIVIRTEKSETIYYEKNVDVDEVIKISDDDKLPANSYVEVYSGELLAQTMTIHTSCSGSFELGQTFGAVQLFGFQNDDQGVMKMGSV